MHLIVMAGCLQSDFAPNQEKLSCVTEFPKLPSKKWSKSWGVGWPVDPLPRSPLNGCNRRQSSVLILRIQKFCTPSGILKKIVNLFRRQHLLVDQFFKQPR
jgi:hypothetical protein